MPPSIRRLRALALSVPLLSLGAPAAAQTEPPPWLAPPAPPELPRGEPLPVLDAARHAGWFLAPEPAASGREDRAEEALEAIFDDDVMQDRVRAGDVDGWYGEVGHRLDAAFAPDMDAIQRERQAGMSDLQRVFDELSRYGTPPSAPASERASLPIPLQVANPTSALERTVAEWDELLQPRYAATRSYDVVVRATYDPDGRLMSAWVHRSSGLRSLDAQALRAVRAVDGPTLPPRVLGARAAVRADWRLTAIEPAPFVNLGLLPGLALGTALLVDIATRLTMWAIRELLALAARELFGGDECDGWTGPGCSGTRARVELVRVVDAAHLTPAERRAERARARREAR